MRFMVNLMIFIIFAMPVGAVFVLLKRLRQGRNDNGAKEKLFEAIYAESLRRKSETAASAESSDEPVQETVQAAEESVSEPQKDESVPLTEEEQEIAMAKKRAAEMLASVKASSEKKAADPPGALPASGSSREAKLTREEALDIVSKMMSGSKKDSKNKGLTAAEIHAMIEKRASEKK